MDCCVLFTYLTYLGCYGEAIIAWTEALALLSSEKDRLSVGRSRSAKMTRCSISPEDRIISLLFSNRAQAQLQLREYESAESDAGTALCVDPGNVKAYLRRATALLALERFDTATSVLNRALSVAPAFLSPPSASPASLPPSLLKTLHALHDQSRQMALLSHGPGADDAPAAEAEGLVDECQTLRLFFRDAPTALNAGGRAGGGTVAWGEWATVSVFMANEFGLWRRRDFPMLEKGGGDEHGQEGGLWLPVCFSVVDYGGTYQEPSARVKVEAEALPSLTGQEEDEDEGERNSSRRRIAFRRGSSCRLRARVRFLPPDETALSPPPSPTVILKVSLPSELLTRQVLPVFSLPFQIVPSPSPSLPASSSCTSGINSCRAIHIPSLERSLLVAEAPGEIGIGGKVWDAGLVLTHYLAEHPEAVGGGREGGREGKRENRGQEVNEGKETCRVIELGAGTGIAGIAAALLGRASVLITDLPGVVPLIQTNIELNLPASSPNPPSFCSALAYTWGEDSEFLSDGGERKRSDGCFDVILLADVIYEPKYYSSLIKALRKLSHPNSLILLAHRERHPDAAIFFEEVDQEFERARVKFEIENKKGQEAREHRGPRMACQDVVIYELRLKREVKETNCF